MPENRWDVDKGQITERVDNIRAALVDIRTTLAAHDAVDDERFRLISEDLTAIREEISAIKVKSGLWGMIGGLAIILVPLVVWLLQRGAGGKP